MLASRSSQAIVPSIVQVASDADRERVRDVVRDVVYPADQAFLDALKGDYLPATPRGARPLVGARTATPLYRTAIRSWTTLDLDPQEVHEIGLESSSRSRSSAATIARAAGFGDDTGGLSRGARPTTRPTPGDQGRARRARAARTSSGRWPSRRATSAPAEGRLRGPGGRGVQGEGRAVRLLLPAGPGRLAARHLLRQRLRPAEPEVHEARHDDLPRGGARATTSRSPSRWRTRT